MKRIIGAIIILLFFSCFYFPFNLRDYMAVNSKMVVAVIGAILWGWTQLRERKLTMNRDMVTITALAVLFSLQCLFATAYNNTSEPAYVDYVVSMWVWMGAAYSVVFFIRYFHGEASMRLVFYYMALLCSLHCILAVMIDNIPPLKSFVDGTFEISTEFFEYSKRIYSIGCSTDTAGIRFSCALLGCAWLFKEANDNASRWIPFSMFLVITIIGNVISRTTLVGVIVSLVFLLVSVSWDRINITVKKVAMLTSLVFFGVVVVWLAVYLYNSDPAFRHYFRYGFEGFFNYFEKGEWETTSTNRLFGDMLVFPDNLKTWLIGDGLFEDPVKGFYMHTDIGYLRIIFLSGLIGLSLFLAYFVFMTKVLCQRLASQKNFFVFIFIVQLVVWVKISTDIFPVYALLLLLDLDELNPQNDDRLIESTYNDTQENSLLLAQR